MSLFENNFLTPQTSGFLFKPSPIEKYVPEDLFQINYTTKQRSYLTDQELASLVPGSVMILDTETYINYHLVCIKHCDTGKYLTFEWPFGREGKLMWILQRFLIVGFNLRGYDLPMLTMAHASFKFNLEDLKELSNKIIIGRMLPYQIEKMYNFKFIQCNSIDLIEVTPLIGSLKLYAGRLHCKRMQDMPIPDDQTLTSNQKLIVKDYCLNDVDNTELLFNFLKPQLELRYSLSNDYNIDLRSKSDAQLAEAVVGKELERRTGVKPARSLDHKTWFYYQWPDNLKFHSPILQELGETIATTSFYIDDDGKVKIPDAISKKQIEFGNNVYRIGIGGLHSSEKRKGLKTEGGMLLFDRDVASYYPSIILNQKLYPRHLGKAFLEVYNDLVQRRLTAKRTGDKVTSNALKICVNGIFGKLGSLWSFLYSPELLIQVTISGQLFLLQLIDMLTLYGDNFVRVKSANTDGVLIYCECEHVALMHQIIDYWEKETGFTTEETQYQAVYARDVNNYVGVKLNGEVKVKGAYSERGSAGDSSLARNPEAFICGDAAKAFLTNKTPLKETIYGCRDIRRFVFVRNVKGGAIKSGVPLGKTIRWYYSTKMKGEINYVISGNRVANTTNAMPLMELPETLPDDLDYARYLNIAEGILYDIGATNKIVLDFDDKFTANFASRVISWS